MTGRVADQPAGWRLWAWDVVACSRGIAVHRWHREQTWWRGIPHRVLAWSFLALLVPSLASATTITGRLALSASQVARVELVVSPTVCSRLPAFQAVPGSIEGTGEFEVTAPFPGAWELRVTLANGRRFGLSLGMVIDPIRLPPVDLSAMEMLERAAMPLGQEDRRGDDLEPHLEILVLHAGAGPPRPIEQAVAWLETDSSCFAVSDAEGVLRVVPPPGVEGSWVVAAAGFGRKRIERVAPKETTKRSVRLTSMPGLLALQVVDDQGRPIEGVTVQPQGVGQLNRSDPTGQVVIYGLPGARPVEIDVQKDGFVPTSRWRMSQTDLAPTPPIRLQKPWRVTARIVDQDQRPVLNAVAGVVGTDVVSVSGQDGMVSLEPLPPGTHAVQFEDADARRLVSIDLGGGGGRRALGDVSVGDGVEIRGWVTDEDGVPIAEAEIFANLDGLNALGDRDADSRPGRPLAETDAAGAFELDGLSRGDVLLEVWADGFLPARVPVVGTETADDLRVTMEPAFELEGQVLSMADGAPIAGAIVDVRIDAPPSKIVFQGGSRPFLHTDADGLFSWLGVPGARHTITAQSPGYAETVVEVEGAENESSPVIIALPPEASLRGVVRDASGEPVARVMVRVDQPHAMTMGIDTSTGEGQYALGGLTPGTVTLLLQGQGAPPQRLQIDLVPGPQARDLILADRDRHQVRGVVVDREGLPVGGLGLEFVAWPSRAGRATATSFDGSFVVRDLVAGEYRIRVDAVGRVATAETRVVHLTEDIDDWRLVLGVPCRVEGQVSGAVQGALAVRAEAIDRVTQLAVVDQESGSFQFRRLGRGIWSIQVSTASQPEITLADTTVHCEIDANLEVNLSIPP